MTTASAVLQIVALLFAVGAAVFWGAAAAVQFPQVRNSQDDFIADLAKWSALFEVAAKFNKRGAACAAISATLFIADWLLARALS